MYGSLQNSQVQDITFQRGFSSVGHGQSRKWIGYLDIPTGWRTGYFDSLSSSVSPCALSTCTSVASIVSSNQHYLQPYVLKRKNSLSSDCGSSNFSGYSSSATSSNSNNSNSFYTTKNLSVFLKHVGGDLWKDNPEHDQFYTFCVSEDDVTRVIQYLENQLSIQGGGEKTKEETDNVKNSVLQDDINKSPHHQVSPKVTFILDTYCHMYMFG